MDALTRGPGRRREAVDTFVWREEHDWLLTLQRDPGNGSPQFKIPDLIGACIALALHAPDGVADLFQVLRTDMVSRAPAARRRQEKIWQSDFMYLQALQRSPDNKYPHPSFSQDQMVTACVAIVRDRQLPPHAIFDQARANMVLAFSQSSTSAS